MSAATKRKFVTRETADVLEPSKDETIVKILASRGNNLHEVQTPTGEVYLVSMPSKYRKNIWIKRGDFVICQPIEEGDKVKAEICHILGKENIEYLQKEDLWPSGFYDEETLKKKNGKKSTEAYELDDDMLPPSSSEDEESDGEEEEEDTSPSVSPQSDADEK